MSSTKWKVGGSLPGSLSLDVEISLSKILNPKFSLMQMCDSLPNWPYITYPYAQPFFAGPPLVDKYIGCGQHRFFLCLFSVQ